MRVRATLTEGLELLKDDPLLYQPGTVRQMWTVRPATDRTPQPGNRLGYGIG